MAARVTTSLLVAALIRRVASEGGNAVVVAKGDPTAGALILTTLDKGRFTGFRERVLTRTGYNWAEVGPDDAGADSQAQWLARRRARDPDVWVVELDIADAERLVAETTGDR